MANDQASKPSPSELMETFPEAKDAYILPRIKAVDLLINQLEFSIKARLNAPQSQEDAWFLREVTKVFDLPELIELKQERKRLMRYLPAPVRQSKKGVTGEEILHAKDRSIVDVAERNMLSLKKSGRLYFGLCPFHEEKKPSFYLYPAANDYHCFGCGAHGDVISLTQKLLNYGFVEAVKYLAPSYES